MKTIVSRKGQITIPQPLRRRLGIRAGQALEVREEAGRLTLAKSDTRDPLEAVYGILKLHKPTDRVMAELRGKALRR
ncbi:MAG TPA: AbrB/MazE/SpoVT family DNA-binding domain-containing protein [Phycisphaerae bacterium]|nr:AbrB/MazE/SpoVT family DNA-binding domain-containing protein [Phycisphaerae bacterium]